MLGFLLLLPDGLLECMAEGRALVFAVLGFFGSTFYKRLRFFYAALLLAGIRLKPSILF